ncbi:hypothetical protein HYV50_05010 [Candidatus Pacearchaeota archaeon]|nr:hypothetical protein [Candidatus Pacearchaeota archaeon]
MKKKSETNNNEEDILEIILDDNKINELINKLEELKGSRKHIHFNYNDKELLIYHNKECLT